MREYYTVRRYEAKDAGVVSELIIRTMRAGNSRECSQCGFMTSEYQDRGDK